MSRPIQTLMSTLAITLSLSTTIVSADPGHERGQNRFMKYFDTNNDGTVTFDEFLASSKLRFERIDTDKNAIISESEFSTYMQNRREQHNKERFEGMDSNKDGKISKDEFLASSQQRAERRFGWMDKNNDGQLSNDELTSRKDHKPRFGKKVFSRIDANGDGKVTQEESQAAWGKWFERMDTNGDKVVTEEEIRQARARWRGKWDD